MCAHRDSQRQLRAISLQLKSSRLNAKAPWFNLDFRNVENKHSGIKHQPCVYFRGLTSKVAVKLGIGNSFLATPWGFGPFASTSYVTKTCASMIFIKCVAKNLPGQAWRPCPQARKLSLGIDRLLCFCCRYISALSTPPGVA